MTIKSNCGPHDGFTLMELLLVIAILGVLTTMALSVMSTANNDARVSATQSRIKKIEAILQNELENYEVRQLPFRFDVVQPNTNFSDVYLLLYHNNPSIVNPVPFLRDPSLPFVPPQTLKQHMRQRFYQDLISVEYPRPLYDAATQTFSHNPQLGYFPSNLPSLIGSSLQFKDWLNATWTNSTLNIRLGDFLAVEPLYATQMGLYRPSGTLASWGTEFHSNPTALNHFDLPAEYLYRLMHRLEHDGLPAIESMGDAAIADTDGDGLLELVDSWGEPLLWMIVQLDVHLPAPSGAAELLQALGTETFPEPPVVDWTQRNYGGNMGMPWGYIALDPIVPRDFSQIRIMVYSKRLNEAGVFNY